MDAELFNQVDRNQDNAIEQTEMRQLRMQQVFDRSDKNNDGYLDRAEFNREMVW